MQNNAKLTDFIGSICAETLKENAIEPALYSKYNVARGLRYATGAGVLAGMTKVGSVQGGYIRDGERVSIEGKLFYRGVEINEMIAGFYREERFGFEEVIYLLLFGAQPNAGQLAAFGDLLSGLYSLPDGFTENMIIKAPSRDIMNKLARSILAMYSYDDDADLCTPENMLRQCLEIIARTPVIISHAYSVKRHYYDMDSLFLHRPQPGLSFAENLLYTLRRDDYTPEEARMLDLCLILQAEHGGGNNSAFAARVLSSSGTDTYSAISAAVGSLKGPRHGGANIKVAEMLDDFKASLTNTDDETAVRAHIGKILDKQAGDGSGLIYGLGHAVYTLSDPRALLLEKLSSELAAKHGGETLKEFNLINAIVKIAPEEFYKRHGEQKRICANVDMYSGFVYEICGLPRELYTPVFAAARMPGWCAHRMEEILYGGRIIRPAYRSVDLTTPKHYIPLDERD